MLPRYTGSRGEGGGAHRAEVVALLILRYARVHAVVLPQHDLPGARVLPEQGPAVVDDEGSHRHALQRHTGLTDGPLCVGVCRTSDK